MWKLRATFVVQGETTMMPVLTAAAAAPTVTTMLRARTGRTTTWVQPGVLRQRAPHRPRERILTITNGKGMAAVTWEPSERLKDEPRNISEKIDAIRAKLKSICDGNINVSAYDTAWVALVKRLDGGPGPQFPTCIDWITKNQMPDGSWGDCTFFLVHDRIINTLACIVALKSWNICHYQCQRGLSFIHGNLRRLTEEDAEWMPVGFEITLPTLLEMAKGLGLDLPYDEPVLQEIYSKRDLKLSKIPKDVLHAGPTTLLLSIEGMPGLDWNRLLKLQCPDGSFMSSPAPTAYALMQTGDRKCLQFLEEIVDNFKEGVPFTYPVDIFERLWVVDRLERLGISRYFTSEIQECLDYVYRKVTQKGLAATRDCPVNDIDDTAMGFRLLRMHGYYVSPSMFKHFEKDGEFVCYHGQTNKSITAMYNTYRAAQVSYPGESELERADVYCRRFLEEKQASGKFGDKWVIPKDLAGEVGYALDFPWRASLPRIETRMYLEQYGGSADVWIGKVLYRMPLVSNDLFLETAREDFRSFQKLCRLEWNDLRKWYDRNKLAAFGVTPRCVLRAYFLAAANIFEPDRAAERLAWARTAVVAEAVSSYLRGKAYDVSTRVQGASSELEKRAGDALTRIDNEDAEKALLGAIGELIGLPSSENASHGLCQAWKQWLRSCSAKEGFESCGGNTALLIVRTVEIASGRYSLKEHDVNYSEYTQLERLTSSICGKLTSTVPVQNGGFKKDENSVSQVDLEMQELAQCVLQSCDSMDRVTRQTFLHVAKSYYYASYCSTETIDSHISKVIFEDVISE